MKNILFPILFLMFFSNSLFAQILRYNELNDFSPIAYYSFSGNANDQSGNENNGTVFGASLTPDLVGRQNSAFNFDGIDDYINIGASPIVQITGNLTISTWIKANSFSGTAVGVISCQADNSDNPETNALYGINFRNSNNFLTYYHESGAGFNHVHDFSNYIFELEQWYHIVVVREVLNKTVTLYVNGTLVDEISYDENPDNGDLSSLKIGETNGTVRPQRFFNGIIDELYLFDKVLLPENIIELYEANTRLNRPTNLVIIKKELSTIELEWEDNSEIEDGYEIERKTNGNSFEFLTLLRANQNLFIDSELNKNIEYCYRVRAFKDTALVNFSEYSNEVCFTATSINREGTEIYFNYNIEQNYPNPFNPSTILKYEIGDARFVKLKVYDALGKEIATLVNKVQAAGSYAVKFDGPTLSSGIYYYKITAGSFSKSMKMVLSK